MIILLTLLEEDPNCISSRCLAAEVIMSYSEGPKEKEERELDNVFWVLRFKRHCLPVLSFFAQKSSAIPVSVALLLFHSAVTSPVSAGVSNTKILKDYRWKKSLWSHCGNKHGDFRNYAFNIDIYNSKHYYNNEDNNRYEHSGIIIASETKLLK